MDISVIIISFNSRDLLKNCIDSVTSTLQGINYEIIVVDNASTDGSTELLRMDYPQVIVVENSENRGFGAANNQAFAVMRGRYALLLNSDAVLTEGAVHELLSFMENRPEVAITCGQLLNADGSPQNSIASFPSLLTLMLNTPFLELILPRKFPSKRFHHPAPIPIDSGIGACLLVRKEVIDRVGMFDERYFFFLEETDWALQIKRAGWQIYFVPTAFIYHLQGQSIGDGFQSRMEFYRSRYQFIRKWHGAIYYEIARTIIFCRLCVNWLFSGVAVLIVLCCSRKMKERFRVYSRLLLWHFRKDGPYPV